MSVSKPQQAYASIMSDIREANFKGTAVPCQLLLSGDHSFPLAMNSQGHVLMAASQYGLGRIVVFSHEAHIPKLPDVTINALNWLKGNGNMSVGVQTNTDPTVIDNLHNAGFQVTIMDEFSSSHDVGVYLTYAYHTEKDAQNIIAFMKSGGGVLIGGQAWWWKSQNPAENTLLQFPGNKVSAVAGIHFSDLYADTEQVPIGPQIPTSWKSVDLQYDFKDDLQYLLQCFSQFKWERSVASEILVHGRFSFPIGTTEDERVFLAGGYYGKGRVVVVAHEALLASENMTSFWNNVLHWLDQGRQGIVGVEPESALKVMERSGLDCKQTGFRSDLSVFVRTVYSSEQIQKIQEFVAEGGGLLIGGHAWYWAQTHPEQNYLTEYSGNLLLNQMGFCLLSATIEEGLYKSPDTNVSTKETFNFRHLLYSLARSVSENKELIQQEKFLPKLRHKCAEFLDTKNFNCYSYQEIVGTLTEILMMSGLPQVSESSPAKSAKDHFLLNIAADVYKVCPNQEKFVNDFFKDIPVYPTVRDQKINFSIKTGDAAVWISTGLYLSPGMKTYIAIPSDLVKKGWQLQINSHTDELNADELMRARRVYERFPVTSEKTLVHNLWGGLIYLIAPPHTQVTGVEVFVQKAIRAPYYKSGVTSLSDWSDLRTAPSPWAELEFENVILTVPSDAVRSLDRPDELAAVWDRMMRAVADLAAIPQVFNRKERFVCDVQISAGWMHSGYPIMVHNAAAEQLLTAKEHKDMWGPIHELGHNQQKACWEFRPHTTEATCNLWSVYVHETVLKVPREKAHESLTKGNRKSWIDTYIKEGRNLDNWKVWVALETYLQLQERFGWCPFKCVFGAYQEIKNVPSDNKGKMNLYCLTFSETVKMNLSGFFKAWGWPIECDTEKKLSNLPAWTDHPMAQK